MVVINIEKKYIQWFNEFIKHGGGQYIIKQNNNREKERILRFIEDENCFEDVDDRIKGNSQLKKLMINFYNYIKEKHNYHYESILMEFPSDIVDRQLEIAKYLHDNPTKREIIEKFGISSKTLNSDLDALREGITLQKNTIKLNINENSKNSIMCNDTVHPIFLPLNLTEIFALTKILPNLLDKSKIEHDEYKFILDIIDRIKQQLSDYALNILFDNDEILRIKQLNNNLSFIEERQILKDNTDYSARFIYYIKHQTKCEFIIENKKVKGYIRGDLNSIKTEDNQIIKNIKIKDVFLGPIE